MALKKQVLQDDGVSTDYHRILYIQSMTNRHISIAVLSYVNDTSRNAEKDSIMYSPYQKATTYELPYDEDMTVKKAYEYLKTLPRFVGAEDV